MKIVIALGVIGFCVGFVAYAVDQLIRLRRKRKG